jgi:alanine-synthesizing transaminase
MFSSRLPGELTRNRLTRTLSDLRAQGRASLDLTLSNPTRAGFDYPSDLLAPLADDRALIYEPIAMGAPAVRQAVAREYRRQGLTVSPDRIVLTASTSDAYSLLFKLLTDAGDEVLVPRPSYPLFEHLTHLDLLVPRPYDLEYDGRWCIDFASVHDALGPRTRSLLIVSPNNPTGSFVTAAELDRLAAMCARGNVAVISDEVFADYHLEVDAFDRAGRVLTRDDVLSFSLGGLSKSAGLPQVKLGWIAAGGPPALVNAALERLELICDTYLSVATPAQIAAPLLLERGATVRTQIQARVAENYRWLRERTASSACTTLRSEAGWYAVLQVPRVRSEEDLVLSLLTEDSVLVHPGYFYDFPREAYLVVSLLVPEVALQDGIDRVLRHFDCNTPAATISGVSEVTNASVDPRT